MTCGAIFDAASLRSQLAEVEKKIAADPKLWSDPEKSQVLMRQRKRLEDTLTTDADLARRVGDISAYFELAREGEAVTATTRTVCSRARSVSTGWCASRPSTRPNPGTLPFPASLSRRKLTIPFRSTSSRKRSARTPTAPAARADNM